MIASNDPYRFAQSYAYNVAPVTDNAPFFFFTLKAGQILGSRDCEQGIDWKVNLGVLVLLLVLVISLVAVLGFLILPLALQGRPPVAASAALFCRRRVWVTFWWRLHLSSASCFFWDIRPTR